MTNIADRDHPATDDAAEDRKLKLVTSEELDKDEAEFRKLRRDLPGVGGTRSAGIISVNVSGKPPKNEFFRTSKEFRPVVSLVDHEVGMEKQFFAVDTAMVVPLAGIGITVSDYTLYLIMTSRGAFKIIPINCDTENEYVRTKEMGLLEAVDEWCRLYTDQENKNYQSFPAPADRFAEPVWPALKPAKIFRLAFRDKGRLIEDTEHPLFKKWAARDRD